MALTPEQIQQLISGFQGMTPAALGQSGGMYKDASGQGVHANYAGGYNPMTGDYEAGAPTEFWVSGPGASRDARSPFEVYNTQGEYQRSGNYEPAANINKELMKYAALLAGTAAAGGAFGNLFGGAPATGNAAAGGFNAAVDSQLANAALGESALGGYGAAGAGGVSAAPMAASGGASGGLGSNLSGLIPSGSGWIGPAATAIGGLLGSKPVTQSQTSTRTTDPRFDPAINGLLGMLQAQIGQQPTRSTLGNITPAGNPFMRK